MISELVAERGGESLDLWARTINPQFARVLRTIGFDRTWMRAEGAYLWDDAGNKFLDLLGGFGMFNVGRNNPRVRAALIEALELDYPAPSNRARRPPPLPPIEPLRRTIRAAERVLYEQCTEAVEAALVAAGDAPPRVLSAEHGLRADVGPSANGNPEFTDRFGPLLPGFDRVPFGDLGALN